MPITRTLTRVLEARMQGAPFKLRLWNGHEISGTREPVGTIDLHAPWALRHFFKPSFSRLAQAYVEGEISYEGKTREIIEALESFIFKQPSRSSAGRWKPRPRNKRMDSNAIRYHYDVSDEFYHLWLDPHRVYSCAYFPNGDETIEQAQERKLDYICRKLMLRRGEALLDVGCGWGALVLWAAKNYGVQATGVTLSRNQYRYASEQVKSQGLSDRVKILLCDYRDILGEEQFDKIASVGMFEHVGLINLQSYFERLHRMLRPGGLLLNHGICASSLDQRYSVPGDTGSFIEQYVFPEGELPHVSLAIREMSGPGFEISDVESLRPHYARTLKAWSERLEENAQRATSIVGERRFRIWRAYLAGCSLAFERGWINVYQLLGAKPTDSGQWALPLNRSHLYRGLARARAFDSDGKDSAATA